MPAVSVGDDPWFDSEASDGALSDGDGAAPETPSNRQLLQNLIDADGSGELGKLAAGALEALIEREDRAALAAVQIAAAAESTPQGIDQVIRAYEAVSSMEVPEGYVLSSDEQAAVDAYEDLKAVLGAETEAALAQDHAAHLSAIYRAALAEGATPEEAKSQSDAFNAEYESMLGIEMSNEQALYLTNPRYLEYQETRGNLEREAAVIAQMAIEAPGYDPIAEAQAEIDQIVANRSTAFVGSE